MVDLVLEKVGRRGEIVTGCRESTTVATAPLDLIE